MHEKKKKKVGENLDNVGLFLVKAQPGSAFSAGGDIQGNLPKFLLSSLFDQPFKKCVT
jgi:hypothetical protein